MINEFLKKFDYQIKDEIIKLSSKYFLINEEIKNILNKNSEKSKFAGIFLGLEKNKIFKPSVYLLNLISKHTNKKMVIDDNSKWLFVCGRDLMGKSIVKANVDKGLVLVLDLDNNILGVAKIVSMIENNDKIVAKNIFDIGDFLRREK